MTTKTKSEKTMTKAERSRQNLAEARQKLAENTASLERVVTSIEGIEARRRAGDASTPANVMVELKEERAGLETAIEANKRKVTLAERSLLTDDPVLAEAVCYALGGVYHGIEPVAVYERPELDPEALVPELYVLQTKPHSASGPAVAGSCKVILQGPSWISPLNEKAIVGQLDKGGVLLKSKPIVYGREISLEVKHAVPEIPRIPAEPAAESKNGYGANFESLIERQTWQPSAGANVVSSNDGKGALVRTFTDESGIRSTVVDVSILVNNIGGWIDLNGAAEMATKIMLARKGDMLAVGRITETEMVGAEPFQVPGGTKVYRRLTCRYTTVSKVGA